MSDSIPIQPPANFPIPDYGKLLGVIGSYNKWLILNELMTEGQAGLDIARLLNIGVAGAMKHLTDLVDAGVVVRGKGRVYQIAPAYRPKDGQRGLDFGHAVLRFGVKAAGE